MKIQLNIYLLIFSIFIISCNKPPNTNLYPRIGNPSLIKESTLNLPKFEGVVNGGGGIGVSCTDDLGVNTIELLDLYEGRYYENLKYQHINSLNSIDEKLEFFIRRLTSHFLLNDESPGDTEELYQELRNDIYELLKEKISNVKKFVNYELPDSKDYTFNNKTLVLPENCKKIQIALYQDKTNNLLINNDYYNLLNTTNKIALWAHEFIFKWHRDLKYKKSVNTRKLVKYLLADNAPTSVYTNSYKEEDYLCQNIGSEIFLEFYIKNTTDSKGKTYIEFISIDSSSPLFRTTSTIKNYSVEDLFIHPHLNDQDITFPLTSNITNDKSEKSKFIIKTNFKESGDNSLVIQLSNQEKNTTKKLTLRCTSKNLTVDAKNYLSSDKFDLKGKKYILNSYNQPELIDTKIEFSGINLYKTKAVWVDNNESLANPTSLCIIKTNNILLSFNPVSPEELNENSYKHNYHIMYKTLSYEFSELEGRKTIDNKACIDYIISKNKMLSENEYSGINSWFFNKESNGNIGIYNKDSNNQDYIYELYINSNK